MRDKMKYIINNVIDLVKIVIYVTICGLISVSFGRFGIWLYSFFYKVLADR